MKGLKTGQKVRFLYKTEIPDNKGNEVKDYKKGIINRITSTGYIIKIVDDMSVKSMDGTLCNRNERDVEPITAPKEN